MEGPCVSRPAAECSGCMNEPAREGPAFDYYRALEGSWLGTLAFKVTSLRTAAKFGARTGVAALLGQLGSSTSMATTLRASGGGFVHTTRVTASGVTVFETSEHITIGDAGRSIRMAGAQHPRVGPRERYEADGEVDADAMGVTYRIPWMGSPMLQRTARVDEGLELTQETPWSRASVLLRRSDRPR